MGWSNVYGRWGRGQFWEDAEYDSRIIIIIIIIMR
jgi:hypothetical protein